MKPTSTKPTILTLPPDEDLLPTVSPSHRLFLIEIDQAIGTLAQWSEATGIGLSTLYVRRHRGDRGRELIRPSKGLDRKRRLITADGVTKTLDQWAEDTGIPKKSIAWRISYDWTPEEAVSIPIGGFQNKPDRLGPNTGPYRPGYSENRYSPQRTLGYFMECPAGDER